LLIREDVAYYPLSDTTLPVHHSYESIFINVPQPKGQDMIIGAIYRPSGKPLRSFNEEFAELIPALIKDKRKLLLMGDFNIDLIKLHNEPTQDFLNIMTSSFFRSYTSH